MAEFEELTCRLDSLFIIDTPENNNTLPYNATFDDTKYDPIQRWGQSNADDIAAHANSPHLSVVERVLINEKWPKDNVTLSKRTSTAWNATSGYLTVGYELGGGNSTCNLVAMTPDGKTTTSSRTFSVVAVRVFRSRILVVSPNTLYVLDSNLTILHKTAHAFDVEKFSKQGCLVDFNESSAYFAVENIVYTWNFENPVIVIRAYDLPVHRLCCDGTRWAVSFQDGRVFVEPNITKLNMFEPTRIYDALHGRNTSVSCEPGPLTDLTMRGAYVAASCGNYRAIFHLLDGKLCIKEGGVDHVYLYGSLLLSTFSNANLSVGMLVEPVFDYNRCASYFNGKVASDAMALAHANRVAPLLPSNDPEERVTTDRETYELCKEFERAPGVKRQIFAVTGGDVTVICNDNVVIRKEF